MRAVSKASFATWEPSSGLAQLGCTVATGRNPPVCPSKLRSVRNARHRRVGPLPHPTRRSASPETPDSNNPNNQPNGEAIGSEENALRALVLDCRDLRALRTTAIRGAITTGRLEGERKRIYQGVDCAHETAAKIARQQQGAMPWLQECYLLGGRSTNSMMSRSCVSRNTIRRPSKAVADTGSPNGRQRLRRKCSNAISISSTS